MARSIAGRSQRHPMSCPCFRNAPPGSVAAWMHWMDSFAFLLRSTLRALSLSLPASLPFPELTRPASLSPPLSPLYRSRREKVAQHHPEEHGDRLGGGDEEPYDTAGQPGVHRRQHEQLQLRRKVSTAGLSTTEYCTPLSTTHE